MPKIIDIDASAWPASGAASAATTGLSGLTGSWSHVASSDVPAGSTANGYVLADTPGAFGILRIPASFDFTSGWAFSRIQIYIEKTTTITSEVFTFRNYTFISGATSMRFDMTAIDDGIIFSVSVFGSLVGSETGTRSDSGSVVIPYNTWVDFTMGARDDSVNGGVAFFINKIKVLELKNIDTGVLNSGVFADPALLFNGHPSLKYRFTTPIQQWTAKDIDLNPRNASNRIPNGYVKQYLSFEDVKNNTDLDPLGEFWDFGGTATNTLTPLATGGINPKAHSDVISGAGLTTTIKTQHDVGTITFSPEGYYHFILPMIYLPDTASFDFAIRNIGDTADVIKLTIDSAGVLKQGITTLTTITKSNRYALGITLKNDGKAYWFVVDLTSNFANQVLFSGQLTDWTVQDIGKIQMTFNVGTAACETLGMFETLYVETALVDSLSASTVNGLLPTMAIANHIQKRFPHIENGDCIPSIPVNSTLLKSKGFGYRAAPFILARTGNTLANFVLNTVDAGAFDDIHGWIVSVNDGGSINDINTSIPDEAARDSLVASMKADMIKVIDNIIANDNKIIMSTMMSRTAVGLTAWTELQNQTIKYLNEEYRNLAESKQTIDQKIQFADTEKNLGFVNSIFFDAVGKDNTHPKDLVQSDIILSSMINDVVTPPVQASTVSNPSSGDIILKKVKAFG